MSDEQMIIEPEGSDFYRPMERRARRGGLVGLVIKMSGGKMSETGANYVLLAFAIIAIIISIIILMITF